MSLCKEIHEVLQKYALSTVRSDMSFHEEGNKTTVERQSRLLQVTNYKILSATHYQKQMTITQKSA